MTTPIGALRLGLFSATMLVVASMVGTGVFTTSGFLLADLQSPWLVLLAWLVGGGLATCGALCYGALARRLPESGGEYLFLSRTVHPAAGAMAGWISIVVGFAAPLAATVRIPHQTGHGFQTKLDSDSTANWTPIPEQTGQSFVIS